MVSEKLLVELREIIREDYGIKLQPQELSEVANTLVGYFGLLAKINHQMQPKPNINKENENHA